MKKLAMTTLLLILVAGIFAQGVEYTSDDLADYLTDMPSSQLPNEDQEILIKSGFFSVEYQHNESNGGVDYLVEFSGPKYGTVKHSKLLFIFSENIKTRKVPAFQGTPSYIIIDHDIIIKFTGKFLKLNSQGQEINVPIFITK